MTTVDVLMITYNSPYYVRVALPALLESADEHTRVWLWHNGEDAETLEVTRSFAADPRVHRFHHSRENQRLRAPTNWLWEHADGSFVSKVDDDCVVQHDWIDRLRRAHADFGDFGAIGCWRFPDEDYVPELAEKKIQQFPGGHRLLRNHWVQGSGYLLRREIVHNRGLRERESFTQFCLWLARQGLVNGWYYPFIREDHMDDPRSPRTALHTDADLWARMPLSARTTGVSSLREWEAQMQQSAFYVQGASLDLAQHVGWRRRRHQAARRLRRALGGATWW